MNVTIYANSNTNADSLWLYLTSHLKNAPDWIKKKMLWTWRYIIPMRCQCTSTQNTCTHTHTHTQTHRNRYTQVHTHTSTHTHRHTETDTHRYTHTQAHTHKHTNTNTHTHTHSVHQQCTHPAEHLPISHNKATTHTRMTTTTSPQWPTRQDEF